MELLCAWQYFISHCADVVMIVFNVPTYSVHPTLHSLIYIFVVLEGLMHANPLRIIEQRHLLL